MVIELSQLKISLLLTMDVVSNSLYSKKRDSMKLKEVEISLPCTNNLDGLGEFFTTAKDKKHVGFKFKREEARQSHKTNLLRNIQVLQ